MLPSRGNPRSLWWPLQWQSRCSITEVDFEAWKEALGSRDDVTLKLYPGLNHLFMPGEGMATPAEYGLPNEVADEVIEDIAAWILEP